MDNSHLQSILEEFHSKRIAVVGDVMLDIYHRGSVNRISPEAPVPVVSIDSVEHHAGGAANVAANLQSLGAGVDIFGVVGDDQNGNFLASDLQERQININGLLRDNSRATTAKTRVIAGSQHVVRTDLENTNPLNEDLQADLLNRIRSQITSYDAIILQDYNKGVLQPPVIKAIIQECCENDVLVTVDPKFINFYEYQDANLVKPNLKEVRSILGRSITSDEEIQSAGQELLEQLRADYLLITLGAQGMEIFNRNGASERLPTQVKKVADVSGAGDTVIATVTLALAAGASLKEAAVLGNVAAGSVCEEVGIVPITLQSLQNRLS
ncbi:MAG: Bifunctional protein HldE [Candidatus Marinimicrobia bacterium]|nr:Bifunctional protein HldE [Candidatus Neomarinimicrobiota bacterium]